MIKVFLVEDEIIVRNGIKKQINWAKEGMDFVGEASDGELAYPMIQQLKPDIIITDIKMPFMDGLQLSKLVKSEMPWIKIIILSGYDEFDYAKKAISIGITDYLLKPISSADLLKAVVRVANIIYEEQLEKENVELYKLEMKESEKEKQYKFFMDLVSKKIPVQELLEKSKEMKMNLVSRCYNIALCKIFENGKELSTLWDDKIDVELEYIKQQQNHNIIVFDRGNEGIAFLVKGSSHEEIEEEINTMISFVKEKICNTIHKEYFFGIGIEVSRLSELHKCFDDACKAFAYRYIVEKNEVMYCENINDYRIIRDMEININDIVVNKIDKKVVDSFLRTGLQKEIEVFLKEYFSNIGEKNLKSYFFLQYITMDVYFCCISLREELGFEVQDIIDQCGDLKNLTFVNTSLEMVIDYLTKVFYTVIGFRDNNSVNKYGGLIALAKEYINDNYSSDDISLNFVANKVNVSTSHFSTIFSQETGENFVEYLTSVRMNKAKELLRCSSMKSSDIGYSIGYKDPHYFSFLFKKTQGFTPKEYRLRGIEEV